MLTLRFFRHVAVCVRELSVDSEVVACRAALEAVPWWRWLRRFHLQRELEVLELASLAWHRGAQWQHEVIHQAMRGPGSNGRGGPRAHTGGRHVAR